LFVFSCTVLFVSISQVIGCEDRLRNDLYCVGWGVKLYSNQREQLQYFSGVVERFKITYMTFFLDFAYQKSFKYSLFLTELFIFYFLNTP